MTATGVREERGGVEGGGFCFAEFVDVEFWFEAVDEVIVVEEVNAEGAAGAVGVAVCDSEGGGGRAGAGAVVEDE
jgi:hypothetical protein